MEKVHGKIVMIEANLIEPRVRELRTRCLIIEHEG
jgi:hypothetical protein